MKRISTKWSFAKYEFDPLTLSVRPVHFFHIRPIILCFGLLFLFAAGWVIIDQIVSSPQEQVLISENQAFASEVSKQQDRNTALTQQVDELSKRDRELYRLILQTDVLPEDLRQVGVGGTDPYSRFDGFSQSTAQLLRSNAEMLDELERKITLHSGSLQSYLSIATKRKHSLAQLPSIPPTDACSISSSDVGHTIPREKPACIVSSYGTRLHPILSYSRKHLGIDIVLPENSPIWATAGGVVEKIGFASNGYGHYLLIDHPASGYKTLYAHLNGHLPTIREGTKVVRGEQIAWSGNTGLSTGPHIHYEVRNQENQALDPYDFFGPSMTPQQYHEILQRANEIPPLD